MKPYISIISLRVHSLERATAFYKEGLALPLSAHSNESISFFELSGAWLGLYPWDLLAEDATCEKEGSGFRGVTLAHNLPSTAEVDKQMLEVERAGGTIVKKPEKVFWGGYSGYFHDLDGHLWELAYNPHFDLG